MNAACLCGADRFYHSGGELQIALTVGNGQSTKNFRPFGKECRNFAARRAV
jgi:hypothetical protein